MELDSVVTTKLGTAIGQTRQVFFCIVPIATLFNSEVWEGYGIFFFKYFNFFFSSTFLSYFPRNKPSKSVTVLPGQFIVLNDSTSMKRVIKIYFNFFRFFLKGLELFQCNQGDRYMTANRNFICFAYS